MKEKLKVLREKLQTKESKGFTLVEMLVVVALIAIMVSISIPMFSSSTANAKEKADMANERAAKALAAVEATSETFDHTTGTSWYYDAKNGKLELTTKTGVKVDGYNQVSMGTSTPKTANSHVIKITFKPATTSPVAPEKFEITWVAKPTAS